MGFTFKLLLAAIVASASLGVNAAGASAAHYDFVSGGVSFTGHIVGSSSDARFVTSIGTFRCNESDYEGTIDTSEVAGETEVGEIDALTFTQNGDHECSDTIGWISDCEWELDHPIDIEVDGDAQLLKLHGASMTMHCILSGFIPIECTYDADIEGSFGLGSNHATFSNQTLSGAASPCPASGSFSATYGLTTEAGGPVVLESAK